MIAEILGTMMLVLFGDGVVAGVLLNKSKAQNAGWIVIATGWGFAVMIGVYTSKALGGPGHLNPAVTVAEMIRHSVHTDAGVDVSTGIQLIVGQFLGAILGAILVFLTYYLHWEGTEDKGFKLGVFCSAPAIRSLPWNMVTEAIGTFRLVFGCFAIFGKKRRRNSCGARAVPGRDAGMGHRAVARRTDRLCDQPARIWARESHTSSCLFPARAAPIGRIRGCPSSVRSSAQS